MKVFTQNDYAKGICLQKEIGMPYESRWTVQDAIEGLCDPEQVGTPQQSPDQQPFDPQQSLTDDERVKQACAEHGVDINDISAVTRLMFSLWPYSFSKTHGPLVRGESDRVEAEKALRQSAAARLADLTATKLKAMDDKAIWLKVIAGVQQNVDADTFDRILTAWGIDPAELVEMIDSGELAGN